LTFIADVGFANAAGISYPDFPAMVGPTKF